jgi:hypothetical protein
MLQTWKYAGYVALIQKEYKLMSMDKNGGSGGKQR